jgi:hypothetical protein
LPFSDIGSETRSLARFVGCGFHPSPFSRYRIYEKEQPDARYTIRDTYAINTSKPLLNHIEHLVLLNQIMRFEPEKHLYSTNEEPHTIAKPPVVEMELFSHLNCAYLTLHTVPFPLFTHQCITYITQELELQHHRSHSPSLEKCSQTHPFLHSALTHHETLSAISQRINNGTRNRITPINHYEVIHKANTESGRIILRHRTVAYPYTCIINTNMNGTQLPHLPLGYAVILKGRVIENLAMQLRVPAVLCPTFTLVEETDEEQQQQQEPDFAVVSLPLAVENLKKKIVATVDMDIDVDTGFQSEHLEMCTQWLNEYYTR